MAQPLLSVVTVVKNDFAALSLTGKSLYPYASFIEWIVVDGTPDRPAAESVTRKCGFPVYLISGSDEGIYDAMNKGTQHATGKYIQYLNAGDQLLSLEKLKQLLRKTGTPKILFADTWYGFSTRHRLKKAAFYPDFFRGMPFCHQSVLFPAALKSRMVYHTRYLYAADYDLLLRFVVAGYQFEKIPWPLTLVDPYGVSNRYQRRVTREQWRISVNHGCPRVKALIFFGIKLLLSFAADGYQRLNLHGQR
ncbi:MAG: glycosyltransferase [Bacteroidia bacterium]|nr:glycosyltransferase [Bacteroidia bacterium]